MSHSVCLNSCFAIGLVGILCRIQSAVFGLPQYVCRIRFAAFGLPHSICRIRFAAFCLSHSVCRIQIKNEDNNKNNQKYTNNQKQQNNRNTLEHNKSFGVLAIGLSHSVRLNSFFTIGLAGILRRIQSTAFGLPHSVCRIRFAAFG